MTNPLRLPRVLAIELMHTAQLSPDAPVHGLIGAQAGIPRALHPLTATNREAVDDALARIAAAGQRVFAHYTSRPDAPAEPDDVTATLPGLADDTLLLIVSLNTKGVLETRAWQPTNHGYVERALSAIATDTAVTG